MVKKTSNRGRPRVFDREQALASAMDVFWTHGYEAASLAQLTKVMGINPPSLYAAFGNKENLFLEVISYYLTHYGNYRQQALEQSTTAKEGIRALLVQTVAQFYSSEDHKGCLMVLAALVGSPNSVVIRQASSEERRRNARFFEARLRQGQKDGDVDPELNLPMLAEYFTTFLFGLSIQARDGVPEPILYDIVDVTVSVLR